MSWGKESQPGEGLSAPQRGKVGGRRVGGGEDGESSGDVPLGETFQVPSLPGPGPPEGRLSHTPAQEVLSSVSLTFLWVWVCCGIILSASAFNFPAENSPSTSTSQVRRPARRGGWGRVVCLGSPASLLAAPPPAPCPRRTVFLQLYPTPSASSRGSRGGAAQLPTP